MRRIVKLADLTPEQRALVLALIAAKKSADARAAKLAPTRIVLRKLAARIAPQVARPRAPDSAVFARDEHD